MGLTNSGFSVLAINKRSKVPDSTADWEDWAEQRHGRPCLARDLFLPKKLGT